MDKALFEKLYSEHRKSLQLYLYSICRDYSLAEELMQETFVKAMLTLNDTHGNFKAWLFTVGKNLALNRIKRDKRVDLTDEFEHFVADQDIITELITGEKNKRLYQVILALPMRMRQIVTLHYFSGLSLNQIAEILNMSPGNVRIVAYRARQEMKNELEDKNEI